MLHFNYNGKIFTEDEKIIGPQSRALRYGDGLFETIKYKNDRLILFDKHFERLLKGMQLLHFEIPKRWTGEKIEKEIIQLAEKNKLTDARIRINVFRGDGGIYDPENYYPHYIIEAMTLPATGELNINGLQLCIYCEQAKAAGKLSGIKSNNALIYSSAAFFAKENKYNDAIILNQTGNVCESTIANIFLIKNGVIKTPAIEEGCIEGIMRNRLIQDLKTIGFIVEETTVTTEELLNADEVFLSNSIYNIKWVAAIGDKSFTNNMSMQIFNSLQTKFPEIIC